LIGISSQLAFAAPVNGKKTTAMTTAWRILQIFML
jgi:hypothetical protein